ncbi:hypothetical protein DM02DRAFT_254802 [Periconia macrospinosa]|uniref:Uncharacterized protein n=1 Tax=Periconia macrospinosa TaxID=97972 RepID=A0A2V1DY85_9PLEO|nr:hypothetical protein DM02DRAFT_254802 [Periconia macrospinosa]
MSIARIIWTKTISLHHLQPPPSKAAASTVKKKSHGSRRLCHLLTTTMFLTHLPVSASTGSDYFYATQPTGTPCSTTTTTLLLRHASISIPSAAFELHFVLERRVKRTCDQTLPQHCRTRGPQADHPVKKRPLTPVVP